MPDFPLSTFRIPPRFFFLEFCPIRKSGEEGEEERAGLAPHYPAEELQSLVCLSSSEVKDLFLVPSAFIIAARCVAVHSCVKSSNMHTSALHATGRNPREEERSALSATRNVLACCSWPHPYYLIRLTIPPHSSSVPPPSYYRGRSRQLCPPRPKVKTRIQI